MKTPTTRSEAASRDAAFRELVRPLAESGAHIIVATEQPRQPGSGIAALRISNVEVNAMVPTLPKHSFAELVRLEGQQWNPAPPRNSRVFVVAQTDRRVLFVSVFTAISKLGKRTSAKKKAASRQNAKLGGRPQNNTTRKLL